MLASTTAQLLHLLWVYGRAGFRFGGTEHGEQIPGKLVRVELRRISHKPASFVVSRSVDNLHGSRSQLGSKLHRGRVLPVRNRGAAQLLSREMEILCNDQIYEESLAIATDLIDSSASSR